jgi:hypothetical protein
VTKIIILLQVAQLLELPRFVVVARDAHLAFENEVEIIRFIPLLEDGVPCRQFHLVQQVGNLPDFLLFDIAEQVNAA